MVSYSAATSACKMGRGKLPHGDFREQGERLVPYRWEMVPLDKEGHRTSIQVHEFVFDPPIEDDVFTTRNLKKWDPS